MSQTPTDGCYFSKAEQWQPVAVMKIIFLMVYLAFLEKVKCAKSGKSHKCVTQNTAYTCSRIKPNHWDAKTLQFLLLRYEMRTIFCKAYPKTCNAKITFQRISNFWVIIHKNFFPSGVSLS